MPGTDTRSRGCPVPAGVILTAAVLLAALAAPPGTAATAAMLTSVGTATAAVTTAAACASGTPFATALAATTPAPALWWRFGEAAGATTVADAGSGGLDGQVTGSSPAAALRLGDPGLPECDTTGGLRLLGDPSGGTGFVVLPAARPEPATMTVAVWLQAAPGTTGGLVGFGDTATGPSTVSDRVLALDSAGRVTFRFETATGPATVRSSVSDDVTDGTPHLVVATVTPAGGGQHDVRLYVDGTSVDTASGQVLATAFTGYWRTGDPGGPGADATLDELALWEGGALAQNDIAALAAADHW